MDVVSYDLTKDMPLVYVIIYLVYILHLVFFGPNFME